MRMRSGAMRCEANANMNANMNANANANAMAMRCDAMRWRADAGGREMRTMRTKMGDYNIWAR